MSKRIQFAINPCSIHGYCLLIDKKTGGDQLSLQMPIEIAEFIVLACNAHEDLLTACKKGLSEMQVWNNEGCDCPPEGHVCGFLRLRASMEFSEAAIAKT